MRWQTFLSLAVLFLCAGCPPRANDDQSAEETTDEPVVREPDCAEYVVVQFKIPDGEVSFELVPKGLVTTPMIKVTAWHQIGDGYHAEATTYITARDDRFKELKTEEGCVLVPLRNGGVTHAVCGVIDLDLLIPYIRFASHTGVIQEDGNVGFEIGAGWSYRTKECKSSKPIVKQEHDAENPEAHPKLNREIRPQSDRFGYQWVISSLLDVSINHAETINRIDQCVGHIAVIRTPNPAITE